MIEVVSPARTLRFKGETSAEHRLWSDSLHTLCNPPKALAKPSVEEEKQRKLERDAEDAKALARLREQERDRIADLKRAKEYVADSTPRDSERKASVPTAAAAKRRPEATAEHKAKREEQPETEYGRQRGKEQQTPRSERSDSPERRKNAPARRRSDSPSRSCCSDSDSDTGRGQRGRSQRRNDDSEADDSSDEDGYEPRARAPAARKVGRDAEQRVPPHSARSRRQSSEADDDADDDRRNERDRLPPQSARERPASDASARARQSARRSSVSEHDSDSDNDEDDEDAVRQRQTPRTAGAEHRPTLLVSQIKATAPMIADPSAAQSQHQRGASPVSPVSKPLSSLPSSERAGRTAGDRDDNSEGEDDPEEESPRESTPRAAASAPIPQQRHERVDSDDESKVEASERHASPAPSPPRPVASAAVSSVPKPKKQTEYFDDDDDDDDDEEEGEDDAPVLSAARQKDNQVAPSAHEPRHDERLKSGGNGAIARDNNFVEDDWDAEDEAPPARQVAPSPVKKVGTVALLEQPRGQNPPCAARGLTD